VIFSINQIQSQVVLNKAMIFSNKININLNHLLNQIQVEYLAIILSISIITNKKIIVIKHHENLYISLIIKNIIINFMIIMNNIL
jgi:hypothetical protein